MARIAMVAEREAHGSLKVLYAEIKAGMGTPRAPGHPSQRIIMSSA